jgi:hypothetical protein
MFENIKAIHENAILKGEIASLERDNVGLQRQVALQLDEIRNLKRQLENTRAEQTLQFVTQKYPDNLNAAFALVLEHMLSVEECVEGDGVEILTQNARGHFILYVKIDEMLDSEPSPVN